MTVACVPHRLLAHSSKPVLFVEYATDGCHRRRRMPLRGLQSFLRSHADAVSRSADNERALTQKLVGVLRSRHSAYLVDIDDEQLRRMLSKLLRRLLRAPQPAVRCDLQNRDLNKLDDAELQQIKDEMDNVFKRQQIRPDDPKFVYDVEKDFGAPTEDNDWDDAGESQDALATTTAPTPVQPVPEQHEPEMEEEVVEELEEEIAELPDDDDDAADDPPPNVTATLLLPGLAPLTPLTVPSPTALAAPLTAEPEVRPMAESEVQPEVQPEVKAEQQPEVKAEQEPEATTDDGADAYSDDFDFGAGDTNSEASASEAGSEDEEDEDASEHSESNQSASASDIEEAIDEDISYDGEDDFGGIEGDPMQSDQQGDEDLSGF
ncbi:hypothetical protein RI367_005372 [Sorochytrium milnesiophthora]